MLINTQVKFKILHGIIHKLYYYPCCAHVLIRTHTVCNLHMYTVHMYMCVHTYYTCIVHTFNSNNSFIQQYLQEMKLLDVMMRNLGHETLISDDVSCARTLYVCTTHEKYFPSTTSC